MNEFFWWLLGYLSAVVTGYVFLTFIRAKDEADAGRGR